MNIPSTSGRRSESCSGISFAGEMGYPAKNLHPAIMAASTHASFPDQKCVFASFFFIFLPHFLFVHKRSNYLRILAVNWRIPMSNFRRPQLFRGMITKLGGLDAQVLASLENGFLVDERLIKDTIANTVKAEDNL
jgi:hypothetical protein